MDANRFIKHEKFKNLSDDEMLYESQKFFSDMSKRRTVREFSNKPVNVEVIKNCICTAGSAPSGANLQPWQFVVVSDPKIKKKIREDAEVEEHEFYTSRAPKEWLDALAPLGTYESKPFLETAPYLIAIFHKKIELIDDGKKVKQYYAVESTGIASGILITALHLAGLSTLTHTPSPMNFLNKILNRPANEKPFLLLVVGHPADEANVPDIKRKSLSEIAVFI